jgi:hypothetical protein
MVRMQMGGVRLGGLNQLNSKSFLFLRTPQVSRTSTIHISEAGPPSSSVISWAD